MSVKQIERRKSTCTITCSKCGRKDRLCLEGGKHRAAPEFRAMGWSIPQAPRGNMCPACRDAKQRAGILKGVETRKKKHPQQHRAKPGHMKPDELARLRSAQKARHDEMFGLTGEWER